jgi:ketosteroid isomerase-like protein
VTSVARRWLDARERGDFGELRALTASDARWESPVAGEASGGDAVVEQVRAGFDDADEFATELISLEERNDKAVATIRNTGRRNGDVLDSLQTLFLRVRGDEVASVRVAVDDPEAIRAFWDG